MEDAGTRTDERIFLPGDNVLATVEDNGEKRTVKAIVLSKEDGGNFRVFSGANGYERPVVLSPDKLTPLVH